MQGTLGFKYWKLWYRYRNLACEIGSLHFLAAHVRGLFLDFEKDQFSKMQATLAWQIHLACEIGSWPFLEAPLYVFFYQIIGNRWFGDSIFCRVPWVRVLESSHFWIFVQGRLPCSIFGKLRNPSDWEKRTGWKRSNRAFKSPPIKCPLRKMTVFLNIYHALLGRQHIDITVLMSQQSCDKTDVMAPSM